MKPVTLVGQGSHGCIFRPAMNCRGKRLHGKYVTKMNHDIETSGQEEKISDIIQTIPGYVAIASPILQTCATQIATLQPDKNGLRQCKFLDELTNPNATATTLTAATNSSSDKASEKDAIMLQKLRFVEGPTLKQYIETPKGALTKWMQIWRTYTYLLKSVIKILEKGVVHFDIKFNNILFDKKQKVPILIDFGLSVHIPSLTDTNARKHAFFNCSNYSFWCIDICVCSYIYNEEHGSQVEEKDIDTLLHIFISGNPKRKKRRENFIFSSYLFPPDFQKDVVAEYKTFLLTYVGKSWEEVYASL